MLSRVGLWLPLAVGLSFGVACSVTLNDDLRYTCTSDSDCGGDGYKCAAPPGGAGACCRLSGRELCDGKDNDCNGLVDDGFPAETCNGKDDDCDGVIDNGFDFLNDKNNCGGCGITCTALQSCISGGCTNRSEGNCSDGIDNDGNGQTDCADPTCAGEICGQGCQCLSGQKAERNCYDGNDNDGDGKTDCADEDCAGAGCGDGGCFCFNGHEKEADCADMADNDSDMLTDCADDDCLGQVCQAGTALTCDSTGACNCNGGAPVNETGAALCRDRIDNDCDGLTDCEEADCATAQCNPDGGAGCQCAGGKRTETNCADRGDNDFDGLTDCQDVDDCPQGTACTYLTTQGTVANGTCNASKLCVP